MINRSLNSKWLNEVAEKPAALLVALLVVGVVPVPAPLGEQCDHLFAAEDSAEAERFFEAKVRPLLVERCHKCHAGGMTKGGLRLDSREALLKGGESGPAAVAGKPDESLLLQAVRYQNGLEMPPDGKLNEAQVASLSEWIKAGVVWPRGATTTEPVPESSSVAATQPDDGENFAAPPVFTAEEKAFWAYQPVRNPAPPAVGNEAWVKTPVDSFILHELEQRQVQPAAPAPKLALLRRVTFDLTGLPPGPADVTSFLNDDSPQAFERVVDRLLDSPHYGEHWARHWLDVVRYAESTANDANAVMRYAWRYRNYVIDAFNRDLPYDQFLVEQLAGDLLSPTDSIETNTRRIIATGFLMVGPKALAETDKEQSRLDIVDDQIDVTGRAMLGLTLACARCHDHKFDAIRTTDYYALAGIFRSTEPFQDEHRNATAWWEFAVPQAEGVEPMMVMAPKESQPRNLRVHLRGNRFTLGKVVPRGVPRVVDAVYDSLQRAGGSATDPAQPSSGRLELAQWIASPSNPLTARVMVNRIWQHHFGRGLVATSDNFGMRGERPSHPELLDWLASQFVASGWSVKAMHRLMVLSSTYQQGGTADDSASPDDPDRKWCSSYPPRRLTAEEIRDAMLAVSGQLDQTLGAGESGEFLYAKAEDIGAKIRPNRVAADDPFYTQFSKRTIYLPVVRNMLPDVLALFDAADPNDVTAVRNDTTVASQSLFLLNSPFVREQSRHFAERLLADPSWTDDQRIDHAHALAFGRQPTLDEQHAARAFLDAYLSAPAAAARTEPERRLAAWQSYCQSLLCSNEFLYLE